MLSGATCRAAAMVGTPVFRMVVSRDSMKKATAINQGRRRLLDAASAGGSFGVGGARFGGLGGIGFGGCADRLAMRAVYYR